jgi:hypothetical protein
LALNPGHRDEREKVYLLSKSFWNIASLWRRRESASAALW